MGRELTVTEAVFLDRDCRRGDRWAGSYAVKSSGGGEHTAATFETEMAALINRHATKLTSDQIITTLERALDEALVIAGEPEATKVQRGMVEALQEIADSHIPDQPAAFGGMDDATWAKRHVGRLRGVALAAILKATRHD